MTPANVHSATRFGDLGSFRKKLKSHFETRLWPIFRSHASDEIGLSSNLGQLIVAFRLKTAHPGDFCSELFGHTDVSRAAESAATTCAAVTNGEAEINQVQSRIDAFGHHNHSLQNFNILNQQQQQQHQPNQQYKSNNSVD